MFRILLLTFLFTVFSGPAFGEDYSDIDSADRQPTATEELASDSLAAIDLVPEDEEDGEGDSGDGSDDL